MGRVSRTSSFLISPALDALACCARHRHRSSTSRPVASVERRRGRGRPARAGRASSGRGSCRSHAGLQVGVGQAEDFLALPLAVHQHQRAVQGRQEAVLGESPGIAEVGPRLISRAEARASGPALGSTTVTTVRHVRASRGRARRWPPPYRCPGWAWHRSSPCLGCRLPNQIIWPVPSGLAIQR